MSKRRKRILACCWLVALLGGVLNACGSTPAESSPPVTEPSRATQTTTVSAVGTETTASVTPADTTLPSAVTTSVLLPTDTTVAVTVATHSATTSPPTTATETAAATAATEAITTTMTTTTTVTAKTTTTTKKITTTTTKRTTTTTGTKLGAGVFTDIHRLQAGKSYTVKGIRLFSVRSADNAYTKIQGGYFDGETYYIAALRKRSDGYEDTRIMVVSKKGKLLRESEPLSLDHANNITYNPTLDRLVVTHCHSPNGHYYRYSFVDPHTLTVTKTADKNQPFFAMAYSPEKQRYASARWNGETLDFWDKDMNHLQARSVTQHGSLPQGVFCDGEGVYFVRSAQNGHAAELRIYDWSGNLKLATPFQLADDYEPESINVVGDTTYIIADDWKGNAVVYILRFKEK